VFTKRGRGAPAPYGDLTLGSRNNTSKLRAGYGGEIRDTTFHLTATRFDTKGISAMDPSVASLANPDPDGYRNDSVTGSIAHRLSQRHEFGASFLQALGRAGAPGRGLEEPPDRGPGHRLPLGISRWQLRQQLQHAQPPGDVGQRRSVDA
jgi:hypothetical protein